MEFNGYQQAILYLLGYWQEKRYLVRCVDKHYIDAVAPLFERTRPFLQHRTGEKKDYWCIKSASAENFTPPTLDDVDDWPAFSRAVVELQGLVDLRKTSSRGVPQRRLRLRIYGKPDLLEAVCSRFPAKPKKNAVHSDEQRGDECVLLSVSGGSVRNPRLPRRRAEE